MGIVPSLLIAALAAPPQVELSTLSGEQHAGQFVELTGKALTLRQEGEDLEVPLSEVMHVAVAHDEKPEPSEADTSRIVLSDGSRFDCTRVEVEGRQISIEAPRLGELTLPLTSVATIRFAPPDPGVDEAWDRFRERDLRNDLLVIRKDDVLDHLEGIVGGIDNEHINFVFDDEEIPVKRERVFGVIYARRPADAGQPVCEISLGDDMLKVREIAWDGDHLKAELLAGAELELPIEHLDILDFSLGKVRYLSQMEPRDVEFTSFFDDEVERLLFRYRRDENQEGGPLKLGDKTYARGLWIHSKTLLRYRLGGEYRRFQAVMGIDDLVARRGLGDVRVVISGDGKSLLEADVRGTDDPRPIELDVAGVRDLEILVDFGGDLHIADHLNLADAKVIK